MEGKHELFWNQGDFGYVKGVVDSMMTLCKPKSKVRLDDKSGYCSLIPMQPPNSMHAAGNKNHFLSCKNTCKV